jgi:hypothetical protein
VAIIDTMADEVVALVPTPAGTHGVNWGARQGGGYYAYVTCQHSNALVVIDPDPNTDGDGHDAAVAGRIVLANGSTGAGVTDGTGGQGVKPIPMTHDGWIQPTVLLARRGQVSEEVAGWIDQLTPEQRNPQGSPHADFNHDGMVNSQDFYDFLAAFFGGSERADVNRDGELNSQDFFDFLIAFFTGCV